MAATTSGALSPHLSKSEVPPTSAEAAMKAKTAVKIGMSFISCERWMSFFFSGRIRWLMQRFQTVAGISRLRTAAWI